MPLCSKAPTPKWAGSGVKGEAMLAIGAALDDGRSATIR